MSHSNTVATTASTELQCWQLSEPGGNVAPSSNPQARNLGKDLVLNRKSSKKTAAKKRFASSSCDPAAGKRNAGSAKKKKKAAAA